MAFGHTAFRIARVLALPRIVAKGIAGTVAVIGRLELFLQPAASPTDVVAFFVSSG